MAWFANSQKEWSGGLPLMPAAPPGWVEVWGSSYGLV